MFIYLGCSVCIYLFWRCLGIWCIRLFSILPLSEPYHTYLTAISPSFAMALGVSVLSRLFLKKKPLELIRSEGNPKAKPFLVAFLSYFLVVAFCQWGKTLFHPASVIALHPGIGEYLLMALLVLPCNIIQCGAEEFMMRIIPSRTAKNIWVSSAICTACFLLPHLGNTEVTSGDTLFVLLYYALFGFFGTLVSLKAGGFEYALGIHMANNLFISLVCNYESSALQSSPLFETIGKTGTREDVIVLAIGLAVSGYLAISRKQSGVPETPL